MAAYSYVWLCLWGTVLILLNSNNENTLKNLRLVFGQKFEFFDKNIIFFLARKKFKIFDKKGQMLKKISQNFN